MIATTRMNQLRKREKGMLQWNKMIPQYFGLKGGSRYKVTQSPPPDWAPPFLAVRQQPLILRSEGTLRRACGCMWAQACITFITFMNAIGADIPVLFCVVHMLLQTCFISDAQLLLLNT
jgi:O-glycosyl hydrolase